MRQHRDIIKDAFELYRTRENKGLYISAAEIEKEGYMKWPRIKETIEYLKMNNMKKVGLAFCIGLSDEALRTTEILEKHGFVVYSVCCKCGNFDKTRFGVPDEKKLEPHAFEAGCNPIVQAALLDNLKTELNLILGLCVGHDILFTKYSKAPVSTFIVKDRVTGHNPVIALYTSYHKKLV
jgi:uncharacterized metal-binding protein